jgi:hypothetical protein
MKKVLLLCAAFLATFAASAWAQAGINFAWDNCAAEGGVQTKTSACSSNFGSSFAVGSYILTSDQPLKVGDEVVLDLQLDSPSLVDWWQFFNAGACRATALSASFAFGTFPNTSCFDPWSGQAAGGVAAYLTTTSNPPNEYPDPNRARIKLGAAVANPIALPAATQFYSFQLVISNANTTTCSGCATGATIVLNEISSVQQDGSRERIIAALVDQCVKFNGGTVLCSALPAKNTSWGQVKSMYR